MNAENIYFKDIRARQKIKAFYGYPESDNIEIISKGQVYGPVNSVLNKTGILYAEIATDTGGLWIPVNSATVEIGQNLQDESGFFDRTVNQITEQAENRKRSTVKYAGFLKDAFVNETSQVFNFGNKTLKIAIALLALFLVIYSINTINQIAK